MLVRYDIKGRKLLQLNILVTIALAREKRITLTIVYSNKYKPNAIQTSNNNTGICFKKSSVCLKFAILTFNDLDGP